MEADIGSHPNADWPAGDSLPFIDEDGCVYLLMVSPPAVVEKILDLAHLRPDETLCDLGAGDGRIIVRAAQRYSVRAVGIELHQGLCEWSRKKIAELGLAERVWVEHGDLSRYDLSDVDVLVFYMGQEDLNEQVRAILERKLQEGGRVIAVNVCLPGWKPLQVAEVEEGGVSYVISLYAGVKWEERK